MDKTYTNGGEQNTEGGKKQTAYFEDFVEMFTPEEMSVPEIASKFDKLKKFGNKVKTVVTGGAFALAAKTMTDKSIEEGGKAKENRTYTEIKSDDVDLNGGTVADLNKHDFGAVSYGLAAAVLVYSGRKEIKRAFVYSVRGLYKASKTMLSFAGKAIDELQKLSREAAPEDVKKNEQKTTVNKINQFMGHSR